MKKKSKVERARPRSKKSAPRALVSGAGSTFVRELRYIVVKIKDANKYLTEAERATLERLSSKCAFGRIKDDKPLLQCVCVESDWPEYEPTWRAIEARMKPLPESSVTMSELRKYYV